MDESLGRRATLAPTGIVPLRCLLLAAAWLAGAVPGSATAQGIALSGMGPINRSMGGAATAAPIDALGALYWNPATIGALPAHEMAFGFEVVLPQSKLTSRVDAGALGPGFPAIDLAGSDEGDIGAAPVPSFAFVHNPEDSPWAFGLGLFGVGGFVANYPASATNPILSPSPPVGLGIGPVSAQLDILQFVPTACYRISERLAVGFAPTITMARLIARPAFFASPDDANGDGFASYPAATGTRLQWGAGFQAGVYWLAGRDWHAGATLKSPQWFEPVHYNSEDELGRPRTLTFRFDYPLIVSLGAAYSGWEDYVLACDLRYFDYGQTNGFDAAGFDAAGAVRGLGWDSVLAVSAGVQRRIREGLYLRLGYAFNENPVSDFQSIDNIASALIIQHWLTLGASLQITDDWALSLAYVHGFENEITGPWKSPAGPVPGTSVTSAGSLDSVSAGINVRF